MPLVPATQQSDTAGPGQLGLEHAREVAFQQLGALGPLRRREGQLWAGDRQLFEDTELVDAIKSATGYGCTVFDRNVRVATSAIAAGTTHRALGTQANDDITRTVLRLGQSFRGISRTIGKDWVISYDPLRDHRGLIVGMLAVYRELIEFIGDLSSLRTPEAVFRIDPTGRILDANPTAVDFAGSRRADLLGASVEQWLHSAWADLPPSDTHAEALWSQTDGFQFTVAADTRWLGDGHVVVVRDFSAEAAARSDLAAVNEDLEQARLAAERANDGKSMFLANVSHELRTPLTAILGYSQLLREEAPPEHDHDLERIESSATYLLALIDDVLDLTKAKSGHLDVASESVDLEPLLREVAEIGRNLCSKGNNTLVRSGQPTRKVWGDPTRTRQVLLNLLSNACKFTSNGRIELQVRERAEHTEVAILDSGIGMNSLQLGELFVDFAQVHRSRRVELGGTGLGLALSQRLARAMGGELTVTSEEGVGSRFCLRLPLHAHAIDCPGETHE